MAETLRFLYERSEVPPPSLTGSPRELYNMFTVPMVLLRGTLGNRFPRPDQTFSDGRIKNISVS